MKIIFNHIRQLVPTRPRIANMFATVLLLTFSASAFALFPFGAYRFDAISGTVLDKETRQPIEGVVVVGHWGLRGNTLMNSYYSGPLVVKETVTDKDGSFILPASFATDVHKRGHFDSELYPEIAFFKGGYDFTVYRHNGMRPLRPYEKSNAPKEDEYTLPKWSADRDQLHKEITHFNLPLALTNTPGICADFETLTPRLLAALRAERDRIASNHMELARTFANSYCLTPMEMCILDNNKRNGKTK